MAFKYDIPPFTCRLVHGNYRIYDVNGQQIWKSDGKTHGDKEEAIQKMRELARKQHNNTSKLKKDIVKENLEEANKVIQEALANQVDLTDEERARLQKLSTFIESIRTISTLTGENEEDIIKNWKLHPETLPDQLQDLELDDATFNQLIRNARGTSNLYDFSTTVEEKQQERRKPVEDIRRIQEEKRESLADELELMTDPKVGVPSYQTLWNALSDEQKEIMTPDELRRLNRERELDQAKQQSFNNANILGSIAPQEGDIRFNWENPDYAAIKSIWDRDYSPTYQYTSRGPYDQREHELAAAGHARGSSSIMGNAEARSRSIKMEDLDAMTKLQNLVRGGNLGNQEIIGGLDRLYQAQRGASFEPIATESKIMNEDLRRQADQEYRDNVFNRDVAQAEMNLANTEMNENLQLQQMLENRRLQEMQQYEGLASQIYQLGMLTQNIKELSGEQQQQHAMLQENLWQNRAKIIDMLQRSGREAEAFELQKAANNKAEFMERLAVLAKIAGTIGLVAAQQPVAAAALWAPNVASHIDSNKGGWFGNSAQANSNQHQGGRS